MDETNKNLSDDPVDTPSPYGLADDRDQLSWSWDELTGGVREETPDDELLIRALFEGVPDEKIPEHKRAIEELSHAVSG